MHQQDPIEHRPAFTLIELLVVISIVALLIALLLPAIKKSRETARRTICMSNIRQFVTAIHVYAHENDGSVPENSAGWMNASATFQVWYSWYGWFGLGHLFESEIITDPKGFYCPSQREEGGLTYPYGWYGPPILQGRGQLASHGFYRTVGYYYRIFGQLNPGINRADTNELNELKISDQEAPFAIVSDVFAHFGDTWSHVAPYGLNVAFSDGHAAHINTGIDEYDRAAQYNACYSEANCVGDGTRDPFVFDFWKSLDSGDFSRLRSRWP